MAQPIPVSNVHHIFFRDIISDSVVLSHWNGPFHMCSNRSAVHYILGWSELHVDYNSASVFPESLTPFKYRRIINEGTVPLIDSHTFYSPSHFILRLFSGDKLRLAKFHCRYLFLAPCNLCPILFAFSMKASSTGAYFHISIKHLRTFGRFLTFSIDAFSVLQISITERAKI